MLNPKMSRDRVNGFLRAEGRKVVNGKGEEIVLTGWNFGNWLVPEGYMWLYGGGDTFDRPRRIEKVIRELAGSRYAEYFWKEYRDRYVTKADVAYVAALGYNSVRLPFNWRVLMEDEPGIVWKEEGFQLLDRVIDWCEELGLYAFIDMHCAPGGQTGHNIDDSIDDIPRLFIDKDSWEKALALWEKIADRYKDRWIVGGYDLINEPLHPDRDWSESHDYLAPKLAEFYHAAAERIRKVDKRHLLTMEGYHVADRMDIFDHRFDENMLLHFHRYASPPDITGYQEYIDLSEKLDQPIWMGETGENKLEWFAAIYPLAPLLDIGYCLWTWKRPETLRAPLSFRIPEGWEEIVAYTKGGPRPSYERVWAILDRYLENIRFENCVRNDFITDAVLRQPPFTLCGVDFDGHGGKGVSYSGLRKSENTYRIGTGMKVFPAREYTPESDYFDRNWDSHTLELTEGEFAAYTIGEAREGDHLSLGLVCREDAELTISENGELFGVLDIKADDGVQRTEAIGLRAGKDAPVIRIEARRGRVELDRLYFTR